MDLFCAYLDAVMHGVFSLRAELIEGARYPVLVGEGVQLSLEATSMPEVPLPEPVCALLARRWQRLRRVWEICALMPMGDAEEGDKRCIAWVSPPEYEDASSGLQAAVTIARPLEGRSEAEELNLAPNWLLDSEQAIWQTQILAWQNRCARILASDAARPRDLQLDLPGDAENPDPNWDHFAAVLGLSNADVDRRIETALIWADQQFPLVEARYREVYRLPLPKGMRDLAALVLALGLLPDNPPGVSSGAPMGWERGGRWLGEGISLSPGGVGEWFAPGALLREAYDAAEAYRGPAPTSVSGALDARLEMRFRRDAPQFVSFAWGEPSDGHHFGLWYDSPAHRPRIGSNWARDSAETSCAAQSEMLPFLARKLEQHFEQMSWMFNKEEDSYRQRAFRAARVIEIHLHTLADRVAARSEPALPLCDWPLSAAHPIGSPPLALPPGAGALPVSAPGLSSYRERLSAADLREAIGQARAEMKEGRTAYAYGLGLYLHWYDHDDLRQEAHHLLRDAYLALGWSAFADILDVHVLHRDLPSVGVFKVEPWPPSMPSQAEIHAAPEAIQVLWDSLGSTEHEAIDRLEAHARALRLGLDWNDPVQRALAAWARDEGPIRRAFARL